MFNLGRDEVGTLWHFFAENVEKPPQFETDDDGNIYMIVSDDEKGVSA